MGWYHQDGSVCAAGHVRAGRLCMEGGGPVHDTAEEIARIKRELDLVERVSRETTDGLNHRLENLERDAGHSSEGGYMLVYIPECVMEDGSPWEGRTRYGVYTTLQRAVKALETFAESPGKGLVATVDEESTYGGSEHCVEVYMVHRPDEPARLDGSLWIFVERVST